MNVDRMGANGAQRLRIHDLEEELAGVRHQLEEARDLAEYFKHCLSENAWHFREGTKRLEQQMNHPEWGAIERPKPVDASVPEAVRTVGFHPNDYREPASRNPYAEGQAT